MPKDTSATDLEYETIYNPDFVPLRRRMVSVKTVIEGGKKRYFMRNHALGTYYTLEEHAFVIWKLLDGVRRVPEVINEAGKEHIESEEAYGILLFFAEAGALSSELGEKKRERLRVVSAFRIEIPVIRRSEEFLNRIYSAFRPFTRRPIPWLIVGFMVITGLLFTQSFVSIFANYKSFQIGGSTVLGFFFYQMVILTPVIAIHEIAHGLALVHYKGKPGEIGFGLLYFGLIFYIDAAETWGLKRGQRIVVWMAGILSTLVIAGALVVLLFLVQLPPFTDQVVRVTAFWCFYTAIWNMAPPFETDGYFVLSDALNMPELKPKAYDFLRRSLKRVLGLRIETGESLSLKTKLTYLGYLVLSVAFIAYIGYATLRFAYYIGIDAAAAFLRLFSGLNLNELTIAVVSVFYFVLSVSGYGVVIATAIKKATVRMLKFETIHDRHLSVFLYLPENLPASAIEAFEKRMRKLARKYSSTSNITRHGPLHVITLNMGSTKLAIQQIRQNLRRTELEYSTEYRRFLLSHAKILHSQAGIYAPGKRELARVLLRMADEISLSGGEARGFTEQLLREQMRTTIYLLISTFASIWTIEIPPAQQVDFEEALLPSSLAEDLTTTDLYGEAEEFKKRMIYGYDSLYVLGAEQKENLKHALESPETYQVVPLIEPVKGRLLFVGRTQQVEPKLPEFAPLFVSQVWSGYMDNLLMETNFALSALGYLQAPASEEIQALRDGELTALNRNLSDFIAARDHVARVVKDCRQQLNAVHSSQRGLSTRLRNLETPGLQLIESILSLNRENLESLPERFKDFGILSKRLFATIEEIKAAVEKEYLTRQGIFKQRRRRFYRLYPVFLFLSGLAAILGVIGSDFTTRLWLLAAGLLPQAIYGLILLMINRSFYSVGRYPSPVFDKIEIPIFATAQAVYNFLSTADVLKPGAVTLREPQTAKVAGTANQ